MSNILFFLSREHHVDHQRSQNFQEKCMNLKSIQKKLEEESTSKKLQNYSSLQEMLNVHQVQHTSQFIYISFVS